MYQYRSAWPRTSAGGTQTVGLHAFCPRMGSNPVEV